MKTEYEAKVLEIDVDDVKKLLESHGAKFVGRFEQKRYVYNTVPVHPGKWVRLRSNGNKTTLCFKSIESNAIGGTKEIEFTVPDFEQAHQFLEAIGICNKSYQENIRTSYVLDGVEIDIDEWPMIPAYLEIEGASEQAVHDMVEKLGLGHHQVTGASVTDIYKMYGFDLNDLDKMKVVKF